MFVHVVEFWCKEGTEKQQEEMIRFAHEMMIKIPTVRQIYAGKPVVSPRDVVDSSYQVGWCVLFDDKAGHDIYQVHSVHLEFIEKFKAAWAKVRVVDFT